MKNRVASLRVILDVAKAIIFCSGLLITGVEFFRVMNISVLEKYYSPVISVIFPVPVLLVLLLSSCYFFTIFRKKPTFKVSKNIFFTLLNKLKICFTPSPVALPSPREPCGSAIAQLLI